MNSIYCAGDDSPEIRKQVAALFRQLKSKGSSRYDCRAADLLCKKWGIDPEASAGDD